jgi:hypothetical protein
MVPVDILGGWGGNPLILYDLMAHKVIGHLDRMVPEPDSRQPSSWPVSCQYW